MMFDVVQALNLVPLETNGPIHVRQSFLHSDNKNTLVPPLHGARLWLDFRKAFLILRLLARLIVGFYSSLLISANL